MGGCLSSVVTVVDSTEVLTCAACGKQAPAPWSRLDGLQRSCWTREGGKPCCRNCVLALKIERIKYRRQREAYAAAKEEMYPKPAATFRSGLRRVESGKEWERTPSFRQSWRPPSTLERLLAEIEKAREEEPTAYTAVQRKPSGFVPASVPGPLSGPLAQHAEEEEEHAAGTSPGSDTPRCLGQLEQAYQEECQRQLAELVEECGLQEVDEESLQASESVHGVPSLGGDTPTGGSPTAAQQEAGVEVWQRRRQQWQQTRQARGKGEDSFSGDSANSLHEGERAAAVATKLGAACDAAVAAARIRCY